VSSLGDHLVAGRLHRWEEGGLRMALSRGSFGSRSIARPPPAGGGCALRSAARRAEDRRHAVVPSGSVTLQSLSRARLARPSPEGRTSPRPGRRSMEIALGEQKTSRARTDAAPLHGARRRMPRLSGTTRGRFARPAGRAGGRGSVLPGSPRSDEASEVRTMERRRGRTRLPSDSVGSPKRAVRREPAAPASWGIDAECTVTSGRSS
jgi:hypothetical protein